VDRELKHYCRKAYSRQMIEHVSEQIDKFYWASGAREIDSESATTDAHDDEAHAVYQADDLTQDVNISKLPTRWDTSADPEPADDGDDEEQVDQDTYLSSLTQIQSLSAQRLTLQQKLNTYRTLLMLLQPYRKPKVEIQPNLVWKDAPLALELGKTRTLAIRVAGRVEERFGNGGVDGEDVMMGEDDKMEKVNRVLDSW
jgi:hypothetical protein